MLPIPKRILDLNYPVPVVLDSHWVNGLGVIRGLGAAQLTSLALSHHKRSIGQRSRYAVGMSCPSPVTHPAELVDFLEELGRNLPHGGVLLVTDDFCLNVLAHAEARLAPYFRMPFPGAARIDRIMDKQQQYAAAQAVGVPVPRTLYPTGLPDLEAWPESAFPALVKGKSGKSFQQLTGRQVAIVHNMDELRGVFQRCGTIPVMLQEIIPGDDDQLYGLCAHFSMAGEPLAVFTARKIRQSPPFFGTGRVCESVTNPVVAEQGVRLLRALDFNGTAHVEFKYDPRDGQYKLLEINARFWKWHSLATACGQNMAVMAYRDALGRPVEPITTQKDHISWVMGLDELLRFPGELVMPGGSLKRQLKGLGNPWVHAAFDVRDPLPWLAYLSRFLLARVNIH